MARLLILTLLLSAIPAQARYTKKTAGTCGADAVTSKAECEEAAVSLNHGDTTAQDKTASNWHMGCFAYNDNTLYHNSHVSASQACSSQHPCICRATPSPTYYDRRRRRTFYDRRRVADRRLYNYGYYASRRRRSRCSTTPFYDRRCPAGRYPLCTCCPAGRYPLGTCTESCGSFGTAASANIGHGVVDASGCSFRPRAVAGLAVACISVLVVLTVVWKCRADVRAMSGLKLMTITFAFLDFFSDGFYISTAEYADGGLQAASLTVFILPTIVFCLLSCGTIKSLFAHAWGFFVLRVTGGKAWSDWHAWDLFVRKVTGGKAWKAFHVNTFDRFIKTMLRTVLWGTGMLTMTLLRTVLWGTGMLITTLLRTVLWGTGMLTTTLLRTVLWGGLMIVFGPLLLVLAINAKLFAFDTLASAINSMTGKTGDNNTVTLTTTSVNLSLLCELVLESAPQLIIMAMNQHALGEGGGFAFYFVTVTSGLAILNGVWPIVFWMKHKKSIMGGLDVALFDKWTCAECTKKVGASTMECTKDGCSGTHPELATTGRRATPAIPRAATGNDAEDNEHAHAAAVATTVNTAATDPWFSDTGGICTFDGIATFFKLRCRARRCRCRAAAPEAVAQRTTRTEQAASESEVDAASDGSDMQTTPEVVVAVDAEHHAVAGSVRTSDVLVCVTQAAGEAAGLEVNDCKLTAFVQARQGEV